MQVPVIESLKAVILKIFIDLRFFLLEFDRHFFMYHDINCFVAYYLVIVA